MSGLTPKDSQGLMEDMFILQNQQRRMEDSRRHQQVLNEHLEDQEVAVIATHAIKVRNAQIENLQSELSQVRQDQSKDIQDRNEIAAASRAAASTIKALAAKIAELTGAPHLQVLEEAKFMFSKRYDAEVDAAMQRGSLGDDPRLSGRASKRELYVPGAGGM